MVGHLALNKTRTLKGEESYWGGAGYHVAWAAASFLPKGRVGLVSVCGRDFDLTGLEKAGVDLRGVRIEPGKDSDVFVINENSQGRSFKALGRLALGVSLAEAPEVYQGAEWWHLATATPQQQQQWLGQLGGRGRVRSVSGDSFEIFVKQSTGEVVKVFESLNLIFANKREWSGVGGKMLERKSLVLKRGSQGAIYFRRGKRETAVWAPRVKSVVDTTGAGEVLAGVFLAWRLRGFSARKSLEAACRVASWSVEDFGVEHLRGDSRFKKLVKVGAGSDKE